MSFLRTLSAALGRLSERMQGQDVERRNAVPDNRLGGDYTAVLKANSSQGTGPLGFGR